MHLVSHSWNQMLSNTTTNNPLQTQYRTKWFTWMKQTRDNIKQTTQHWSFWKTKQTDAPMVCLFALELLIDKSRKNQLWPFISTLRSDIVIHVQKDGSLFSLGPSCVWDRSPLSHCPACLQTFYLSDRIVQSLTLSYSQDEKLLPGCSQTQCDMNLLTSTEWPKQEEKLQLNILELEAGILRAVLLQPSSPF